MNQYIAPTQLTLSFYSQPMGNTSSCTPIIRVINSNGSVHEHPSRRSVRAAEQLMHDNPGRFVCDSSQLKVGSRIAGLSADDNLEPGRLYFLLPMDLLYSALTEEEMVSFACVASTKRRGRSGSKSYISRKIFPVLSEFCLIPSEAKKIVVEELARRGDMLDDHREVSRQWSWRPALDTIQEVS